MKTTIAFKCEGLIDQGRYIGDDPVGSACCQDATKETPSGYLLCDRCTELLVSGSPRLTFLGGPHGIEYQQEIVSKYVRELRP